MRVEVGAGAGAGPGSQAGGVAATANVTGALAVNVQLAQDTTMGVASGMENAGATAPAAAATIAPSGEKTENSGVGGGAN